MLVERVVSGTDGGSRRNDTSGTDGTDGRDGTSRRKANSSRFVFERVVSLGRHALKGGTSVVFCFDFSLTGTAGSSRRNDNSSGTDRTDGRDGTSRRKANSSRLVLE